MEVAHRGIEVRKGFCKEELSLCVAAVDEDTTDSRRTHVAERVVFTTKTFCESCVHIHVLQGIDLSLHSVAESLIYCPYLDSLWNLLVGAERVGADSAFRSRSKITIFVDRVIISLCRNWQSCSTNQ